MNAALNQLDSCKLCHWLELADKGQLETLIWQTPHSIAVVGEHQYFQGYCMVISRRHVREMHSMPEAMSTALFQDVLRLGAAVEAAFTPWKINYASLGNVVEHLHWHVIPRYDKDPDHKDHPWKNSTSFASHATSRDLAKEIAAKIVRAKGLS